MKELDKDILAQIGYLCDSADEEIAPINPKVEKLLSKLGEVRELINEVLTPQEVSSC